MHRQNIMLDFVDFEKNKINTAAMGSSHLPIACAGDSSAYTTGFYPTPVDIIHIPLPFRKSISCRCV